MDQTICPNSSKFPFKFRTAFATLRSNHLSALSGRIRRAPLPAPSAYFDRLGPKAARVDVWHTIYNHPMADAQAIVEWVKGTGLRPYLDAAGPEHAAGFLAAYGKRIERAYPPMADGRRLLRFPRLFVIAIKA